MSTIAGTYCPRLRSLQTVLKQWVRLNTRIARSWRPGDVPWWYNERASLSVFAGAIWFGGGVAFEEFCEKKRSVHKKGRRFTGSYSGRVDIYFELGSGEFKAEAKFCWPGASMLREAPNKNMTDCLRFAVSDIRKSPPEGMRRLAILFSSPYVSCVHAKRLGLQRLVENHVHLLRELEPDACAWVFPDIENSVREDRWLYPGTTIAIKEVRR